MSTQVLEPESAGAPPSKEAPPPPVEKTLSRWIPFAVIIGIWIVLWAIFKGQDTLYLFGQGKTGFHDWFTDLKGDLIRDRDTNILMQFTGWLSDLFNSCIEWLQHMFSEPDLPRPVPQVGWFGVLAIAVWVTYAVSNVRLAIFAAFCFLAFGYLGYWEDSIDTLIIVFFSVGLALLIGFPVAVLIGTSKKANAIITPILDTLQTLPAFVYLVPLTLFFGLGAAVAVACTLLYAIPPAVRIAGHGIRSVSSTTIEATDSIGQSRRQRLTKVQLPMAKKTIIVGVNQTIMAALSMVVIAALVNSPGLGKPVVQALTANQVGTAAVAGLCIVLMAILLDRTTTAASERAERIARGGKDDKYRKPALGIGGVLVLIAIYMSRQQLNLAEFPESELGSDIARKVQDFNDWFLETFSSATTWVSDHVTEWLINPLQDLLADSPWWLTGAALIAISLVLAGKVAGITTVVCLAGIYFTDLWYDTMVTLTSVLVATVFVMILALVFGVMMARSKVADNILRPILDAGQVLPAFVYLIPALGLFGPGRFTAIVAALVYAAPAAIKLVADGVRAVSPTTIEAATATGSSNAQIITKVQLPMAKNSIVLAANQGLLYVLAMVVIGGLVGGGGLGYDVVLGFSQGEYFGKGLAAGFAIVLLGIMIDRTARDAADYDPSSSVAVRALMTRKAPAAA